MQFLHSKSSEEKAALIPIITQLLQLSQQEKGFLQETIRGDEYTLLMLPGLSLRALACSSLPGNQSELPDASGETKGGGGAKGWGSYIQRWTGY